MDNHSLLSSRIHSLSNLAYSFFQVRRPHRSTPWLTETNTSMYSLQQYTKQRTTRAFWHVSPCVRLSVSQVIIVRRRCPAGNERVAYSNERKWSTQSNSFVLTCSATTHSRCATAWDSEMLWFEEINYFFRVCSNQTIVRYHSHNHNQSQQELV